MMVDERRTTSVSRMISIGAAILITVGCDPQAENHATPAATEVPVSGEESDSNTDSEATRVVPGRILVGLRPAVTSIDPSPATAKRPEDFTTSLEARGLGLAEDYGLALTQVSHLADLVVLEDATVDEIAALQSDPRVTYVEPDRRVELTEVQRPAPWNLDRLDQPGFPLDRRYEHALDGDGVDVYIVDTGLRTTHEEFTGRVRPGYSGVDDAVGQDDCHGHGTKVAGIVGGTTWGVAKGVTLIPVRVFDCRADGTVSGIIAGLDWIAQDARGPAVANLSLRTHPSRALDDAIGRLLAAGVTTVVAAGNRADDACDFSPSRVSGAITVGAIDDRDTMTEFSSHGPCIDVFAPGLGVPTAWRAADDAWSYGLGTSMAAPHAAGAAALYLSRHPEAPPAEVAERIVEVWSLPGVIQGLDAQTPNRLLNVRYAGMAWLTGL